MVHWGTIRLLAMAGRKKEKENLVPQVQIANDLNIRSNRNLMRKLVGSIRVILFTPCLPFARLFPFAT